MTQKKSKVKKLNVPKAPVNKNVVEVPVHLPVVTEQPKPKTSGLRIVASLVLVVVAFIVWTLFFFKAFEVYNESRSSDRPVLRSVKQNENVVAVIGNEKITLDQVKAFVKDIPQLAEVPFEQVYPNILDMMINDKVIANGAKRYGIQKDPQIQKMIRLAGDQIVAQAYLSRLMKDAVTEDDLKAVYDEEVKNFKPEEEIHARHILLPTEKQAQDVVIQLKAGADFGSLADQKSIDKNAPKGDLGYFTKEMMIPEFGEAVFAMKKGQLSGPIHTAYGWHVVLVEDRRLTTPPSFTTVKEQMRQLAMEKKLPELLAQEKERQKVRILRPFLTVSATPEKK